MAKPKSRRNSSRKPYPDFPLTLHATGQWCKKIRGRIYYFGTDPDAALNKYLDERDDLFAGRSPKLGTDLTLVDLVNRFLTFKQHLLDSGELSPRTFSQYKSTCELVLEKLNRNRVIANVRPDDFGRLRTFLGQGRGPFALKNHIRITRMLFLFAESEGLIEKRILFGKQFSEPSRDVLRRSRITKQQEHGLRMFSANDLKQILASANPQLHAMTLLGINCGFGQTDCATLPITAIDRESGWIDFPRPKTAVSRRIPLWDVTMTSLGIVLDSRPVVDDSTVKGLAFVTRGGLPFIRFQESKTTPGKMLVQDNIGNSFGRLLRKLGIKRTGLNFYALRHTFETVASESRDQVAVSAIMGHADHTMSGLYRERISDERLVDVVTHVHQWLFPDDESSDR